MTSDDKTRPKEMRILPKGWESSRETEEFPLEILGHIMPKSYVPIVEHMTMGLAHTLSRFPILTGVLKMNAQDGAMWVTKRRASTISLFVKHMLHDEEFPTYLDLEKKDFPANLLRGDKLLPEAVVAKQVQSPLGDNSTNGIPIAVLQLNFIRGGLILGIAVHHAVADAPGCDGFLAYWAEATAIIATGKPPPPIATQPVDTSAHAGLLSVTEAKSEVAPVDDDESSYSTLIKDAGGPMPLPRPPDGFQMPDISQQMLHFPKSKAEALKARISGQLQDGWISTPRRHHGAPLGQRHTGKVGPAQARTRPDHEAPPRSACGARCEPIPIAELTAPSNLPRIASAVRASTNQLKRPGYLAGLARWIAARRDKRWLSLDFDAFLGSDMGATSWQSMTAYTTHDFGFGPPKALRWPSPALDGFVFLYPSRAAQKGPDADEGVEVCVCLERGCMERLLGDAELMAYAHPRG
ncbi:hypothetical protein PG988_006698 [Apiospora saccharicola]